MPWCLLGVVRTKWGVPHPDLMLGRNLLPAGLETGAENITTQPKPSPTLSSFWQQLLMTPSGQAVTPAYRDHRILMAGSGPGPQSLVF